MPAQGAPLGFPVRLTENPLSDLDPLRNLLVALSRDWS